MMSGWKTYTGGAFMMLAAISGVVIHFTSPGSGGDMAPMVAIALFGAGLAAVGVRTKLGDIVKKLLESVK